MSFGMPVHLALMVIVVRTGRHRGVQSLLDISLPYPPNRPKADPQRRRDRRVRQGWTLGARVGGQQDLRVQPAAGGHPARGRERLELRSFLLGQSHMILRLSRAFVGVEDRNEFHTL